MIFLGLPSPTAARRPLPEGEARIFERLRNSKPNSAARERVFDQVVNMIESDFVDAREDFESARRLVLEKYQDRRFHRRTTDLYARNLFNDDRRVGREG